METRHLSDTRKGQVHKFSVGGVKGYIHTGEFDDGTLGEVFIHLDKNKLVGKGHNNGPWACIGILISMALQRGVPLYDICKKLSYTKFEPDGVTKNREIPMATSMLAGVWGRATAVDNKACKST